MPQFLRDNSLSVVSLGLFLLALLGQSIAGMHAYNAERRDHDRPPVSYWPYLRSGHFVEGVSENWESAFLDLTVFVLLGKYLRQKGSAESRDPADRRPQPQYLRTQGLRKFLYAHSLGLTLALLFLLSLTLHAWGGSQKYSEGQIDHGQPPVSFFAYFLTSSFWFESLQNWQSEFLSVGAMAVLTIFLREAGSPQSKPLDAPNAQTEA
jgi:hypothetical protein